jgi:hypothetical protein
VASGEVSVSMFIKALAPNFLNALLQIEVFDTDIIKKLRGISPPALL